MGPFCSVFPGPRFPRGSPAHLQPGHGQRACARPTMFPWPLPISRLCPPCLTPAPALAAQGQTPGQRALRARNMWKGAVDQSQRRVLFPKGPREGSLGAQLSSFSFSPRREVTQHLLISWTLIRRQHLLGTCTDINFNCVQPFFSVPQGLPLPLPGFSFKVLLEA